MKIIDKKPPFFWVLKIFFPFASWEGGVIVTYGKKVYCRFSLDNTLIAHEGTHVRQQKFPLLWWIRYVLDIKFRFAQELEAHRNEYRAVEGSRNYKHDKLQLIADRLASELYGNLCTKQEAIRLIRGY
jgi:hypothetical protein